MELNIQSGWLKATDENINNSQYTIKSDIKELENKFNPEQKRLAIDLEDSNGVTKMVSLNKTSQRNLVKAFTKETTNWIGKKVMVMIMPMMVRGEMIKVLVVEKA